MSVDLRNPMLGPDEQHLSAMGIEGTGKASALRREQWRLYPRGDEPGAVGQKDLCPRCRVEETTPNGNATGKCPLGDSDWRMCPKAF